MDEGTLYSVIAIYSLFLFIFGFFTNIIVFFICMQKSLRKVPTFVFIGFIAIVDAIAVCLWDIDHFFHQFFNFTLEDMGQIGCKIVTFIQCVSLQSAAWLLVSMSVERFLAVHIKSWRLTIFGSKKAILCSCIVVFTLMLINSILFFEVDTQNLKNETIAGECLTSSYYQGWMQVHNYLYSVVPFLFLLFSNTMLILEFTCGLGQGHSVHHDCHETKKRRSMSLTIGAMTTTFLLMTLPNTIIRGYFLDELVQTEIGLGVIFIADALVFTYHGFHFVLLMLSNKKFLETLKFKLNINNAKSRVHTTSH